MLKVSFDFDGVLGEPKFQKIAKKLIDTYNEVWIITTRPHELHDNNWLKPVLNVADRLGIPVHRVIFTDGKNKYHYLESFDLHFDDDIEEINLINENKLKCVGVLVTD